MIESNLSIALGLYIEDALKEMRLPSKSKDKDVTFRAPTVWQGYLPPKRGARDDDAPFVLVRVEDTTTERGQTNVTVAIIIGCYSPETDGYMQCLSVFQKIRFALLQLPCQTLANRYQLDYPIKGNNVSDQSFPYWQFEMTTNWILKTSEMKNDGLEVF